MSETVNIWYYVLKVYNLPIRLFIDNLSSYPPSTTLGSLKKSFCFLTCHFPSPISLSKTHQLSFLPLPTVWLFSSFSWSTPHLPNKTAGERGREPQLWGERKPSTISHLAQRWPGGCLAFSLKQKACWEIHSLDKRTSWTEKLYSGGGNPFWQW